MKSFFKSLWAACKAHPIIAAVTLLVAVPLVFGGIAVLVYRAIRGGIAKVAPGVADSLPVK